MINLPLIQHQCKVCIHYCPKQEHLIGTDKYICHADGKTYQTTDINDNGEACCRCHNNKFSYNVEKFKNIRY